MYQMQRSFTFIFLSIPNNSITNLFVLHQELVFNFKLCLQFGIKTIAGNKNIYYGLL